MCGEREKEEEDGVELGAHQEAAGPPEEVRRSLQKEAEENDRCGGSQGVGPLGTG